MPSTEAVYPHPYAPGTSTVDILADQINRCGASVDRSRLKTILVDALASRGIISDLIQVSSFDPWWRGPESMLSAVMDSLGVQWSIRDGQFLTE